MHKLRFLSKKIAESKVNPQPTQQIIREIASISKPKTTGGATAPGMPTNAEQQLPTQKDMGAALAGIFGMGQ